MNFKLNKETRDLIKAITLSGMLLATFYVCLTHLNIIYGAISSIFSALAPFIFGLFFTLILIPLRNIVEEKWLSRFELKRKTKRKISVAISMAIMVLVLVIFFWLLIPQLASSFSQFMTNFTMYYQNLEELARNIAGDNTFIWNTLSSTIETFGAFMTEWLTGASGGLNTIMNAISNAVTVFVNFIIGMIIAMYILLDSEKFKLQTRKLFYACLPTNAADNLVYISRLTSGMFNKFIFGKGVDSLIIGVICYVACVILRIPYSVLIAVVVGLTNMIPVFGPFIGAIPCLIILVMIDWVKAVEFLIFIIILQQVDGNIIGPSILGDAVGLPTLWVMFAIIVGGALFGVVGMFVGVPIFAVIYTLITDWTKNKLNEKKIEFPDSN